MITTVPGQEYSLLIKYEWIKSNLSLVSFFSCCLFAQIYLGNTLLKNSWGFLLYPLASFLFAFVYYYSTKRIHHPPQQNGARPAIIISIITSLIWIMMLTGQVKIIGPLGMYQNIFLALTALLLFLIFNKKEWRNLFILDKPTLIATLIISVPYLILAVANGFKTEDFLQRFWNYFILAGFPEEVVFRYLMLGGLLGLGFFNKFHCLIISSLIFGFLHFPINIENMGALDGTLFCIAGNAFGGFLFGYFYYRTRSLLAVIFLHTLIDTLLNV